jgi:hypothetical protein
MDPTPLQVVTEKVIPIRNRFFLAKVLLGFLLLLLAIVLGFIFYNWPVLMVLLHPKEVDFFSLEDALPIYEELVKDRTIQEWEMTEDKDGTQISFITYDTAIAVTINYSPDGIFQIANGQVEAERSHVSTISQAENLAGKVFSPLFPREVFRAFMIRFSGDIVTQAGGDTMDLSLELESVFQAKVTGQTYQTVSFQLISLKE